MPTSEHLQALASRWETNCLKGEGFGLTFDGTYLECARELRTLIAVSALLAWVGELHGDRSSR